MHVVVSVRLFAPLVNEAPLGMLVSGACVSKKTLFLTEGLVDVAGSAYTYTLLAIKMLRFLISEDFAIYTSMCP